MSVENIMEVVRRKAERLDAENLLRLSDELEEAASELRFAAADLDKSRDVGDDDPVDHGITDPGDPIGG